MPLTVPSRATLVALFLVAPAVAAQRSFPPIPAADRSRLAEAFRLADAVGGKVWPGWDSTPFPVLLITDSVEYLVRHPAPSPDFTSIGPDSVLHTAVWARPRVFPRTFLATAPFISGINTVAVGEPAATGKSSVQWVLTLLHEHFHQLQDAKPGYYAGVASLGLAHGDSTGMWMLDFPFPYDSAPVVTAITGLAEVLDSIAHPTRTDQRPLEAAYRVARAALRRAVSPDDDRYLAFQFWQEGVARYTEYAVARAAAGAGSPSAAFRALPDYEDYATAAEGELTRLHRELTDERPAENRRVIVYSLGAATALLLDRTHGDWKERYFAEPFALDPLFTP